MALTLIVSSLFRIYTSIACSRAAAATKLRLEMTWNGTADLGSNS